MGDGGRSRARAAATWSGSGGRWPRGASRWPRCGRASGIASSDNGAVSSPGVPDLTTLRPRRPSPLQEVEDKRFTRRGVRLLLKRDDLIHPDLVGNKWRKLAPNLTAAAGRPILTFGGAYSNHLRAMADRKSVV